ncbi:MAG: DUF1489 domain-containing protein [Pseudomonadota bacterium]
MPVNILRTAVGIQSVEHLRQVQTRRRFTHEGQDATWAMTRRKPVRASEIIHAQGSLYWIIQRSLCIRQAILDLPVEEGEEGKTYCRIIMDPELVPLQAVARKHMQGWRYLEPKDAPADMTALDTGKGDDLPPEMIAELRALGLM